MRNKRHTVQRQLILDTVKELNGHVTAEQVFDHVVLKYPPISKATVYRNLNQMVDSGKLLRIGNFNDSCRYDHNCHNHYHFMCEKCKRVFDIEDYFSDIYSRIKNTNGFDVTSHNITFGGLCPDCK
jgi:Fe2+ or Zn2+ uptake regulation protein